MKEHRDDPTKATREHHAFHHAEDDYFHKQRKEDAERTLAVLRRVEWGETAGGGTNCRSCLHWIYQGHAPDCELAALIAYWEEVQR